jgi:hypothetical protein
VKGYEGIIEDDYGNLWISSDTELFRFNPITRSIRKYGKYDGVPDINYSYIAKRKWRLFSAVQWFYNVSSG